MAAALDVEAIVPGEAGPRPSALSGPLGQSGRDVEPGEGVGGRRDRLGARERGLDQRVEMVGLRGEGVGSGLAYPNRLLMKVRRVEPDDAGQGLTMGEARLRRHQGVRMPGRNLDMEAEHAVMADLEGRDSGLLAIARLEPGYGA